MINTHKVHSEMIAYWGTVLMAVAVAARYGRLAIEWLLMKLYDFFIIGTIK